MAMAKYISKSGLLDTLISYYDGKYNPLFKRQASNLSVSRVLVISPEFYTQELKTYPINNKRALNKVLKLKRQQNEIYQIISLGEEKSAVVHWFLKLEKLPKASAYIPETALLPEQDCVQEFYAQQSQRYFYYFFKERCYLSPAHGMIDSVERFCMASGIATKPDNIITDQDKLPLLRANINLNTLALITQQLQKPSKESLRKGWYSALIPAAAILTAYLALTSGWVAYQHSKLSAQVTTQNSQVDELFALQNSVQRSEEQLSQLLQYVDSRPQYINLWLVFAPLFESIEIDYIRITRERVSFRGTAEQATTVMQNLSDSGLVSELRFDTPVATSRGKDRFTISFILKGTGESNE